MTDRYALSIVFQSNAHPWSTVYRPARKIQDDDEARKWADDMAEGLGGAYVVTLLRDGHPWFNRWKDANPRPGDPVPCASCHKPTPYQPPGPPDEVLCDDCRRVLDELRQDAEKRGGGWWI